MVDDIGISFGTDDASSRSVVETAGDEDAVQEWLAEQLKIRGRGRYHVHREAEVASGNFPDILVSAVDGAFEVAIEMKHGGKKWTVVDLEQSLRHQLVDDYLRPKTRRHGLLVITHHHDRQWRRAESAELLGFSEVIDYLESIASTLTRNETGAVVVTVRGIDSTRESHRRRRGQGRGTRTSGKRSASA